MAEDRSTQAVSLEIDAEAAADPQVRAAMEKLSAALADADMLDDAEVAGFTAGPTFKLGGAVATSGPASAMGRPAPASWHVCISNYWDDDDGTHNCGLFW